MTTEDLQKRLAAGDRDFQGVSASGASLAGANLKGVNLKGANLRGAILHEADLRDARLGRADLGMADVGGANFEGADLSGADFRGANLRGACFGRAILDGANLRGADLHGADMQGAHLVRADLSRADLRVADLSGCDLRGVDLRGADLSGANLRGASLLSATLHGADVRSAHLTGANLRGANLTDARLDRAHFHDAIVGGTIFADLDLRQAEGLETLVHASPSTVGADTLSRSLGEIPETFLRGCGLAPWEILAARQYDPALTPSAMEDLQRLALKARLHDHRPRKRLLLSHAHADVAFVEALRLSFLERGILTWSAEHESKGEVRDRQSKLPIHHDVTLLLVLSNAAVASPWVEHEIRVARRLELATGSKVLCPLALDDGWKAAPFQAKPLEALGESEIVRFDGWEAADALERHVVALLEKLAPPPITG